MIDKIIKRINEKRNLMITGGGGVGKSYIINQLKEKFPKDLVITSTTGISAIPLKAMTIHKWSGIGIAQAISDLSEHEIKSMGYTKASERIRKCKKLIIDEVSMLKAGQLDLLDLIFRSIKDPKKPFGGIQIILVGDFLQISPVDQEERELLYCFQAEAYQKADFEVINLTKVWRQSDLRFIGMLNSLRYGHYNQAIEENFIPRELSNPVILCAKNSSVDKINMLKLAECKGKDIFLNGILAGTNNKEMYNLLDGVLSPLELHLRVGCSVMITINERVYDDDRVSESKLPEYVNGTMGTFLGMRTRQSTRFKYKENVQEVCIWEDNEAVIVNRHLGDLIEINEAVIKTNDNRIIYVPKNKWTYGEGRLDMKKGEIDYEALFIQYPLRLGYAVTIHKSQGMSLDEVEVDCDGIFCAGQLYVAVSRARTLEGLSVKNLKPKHLITDHRAIEFYKQLGDQ